MKKVFVAVNKTLGGIMAICLTRKIAEREIQKDIDYYDFPESKWHPDKSNYFIEEMEVLET